jgi:mono/diheme cytochrome c family protein
MGRKGISTGLAIVGLCCVAGSGLSLGIVAGAASGSSKPTASPKASVISVTAGTPAELAFKLSKRSLIPVGRVTFNVMNAGTVAHAFKVCTSAIVGVAKNTCVGKATKVLQPGRSASLTVTFSKAGKYEFLCTVSGHAAAGMKGLLGIGVKVAAGSTGTVTSGTGPRTTTPTKTTTTPTTTEALRGDPAAGATVFRSAACGSCHTMRAAGATGNVGPNLDDAKPGQDLVIQRVTNGINAMPAFGGSLSSKQIQDVAAYVYASTH